MSTWPPPRRPVNQLLQQVLLITAVSAAFPAIAVGEQSFSDIEAEIESCVRHDNSNLDANEPQSIPIEPTVDNTSLRVGVREYARPFSFHSIHKSEVWSAAPQAPLAKAGFTGYMSKICDSVLADMLLNNPNDSLKFERKDVKVVDIDCLIKNRISAEGNSYFKEGETISRFKYLGNQIDVLCDPATITNERRHDFTLSPPLFLSGIGMISRKINGVGRGACPKKHLIGQVAGTTADTYGLIAVLETNELKQWSVLLKGYLRDTEDHNSCSTAIGGEVKLVKLYNNHKEASEAFCNGDFHYYLGDREIITFNARSVVGCASEIIGAGQTYTNDRYAIFGKMVYGSNTKVRDLRIARFFEILSQKVLISPSVLDTAYRNTFLEEPSNKLQAFYWSIRGPK